jgi:hypothetical protein
VCGKKETKASTQKYFEKEIKLINNIHHKCHRSASGNAASLDEKPFEEEKNLFTEIFSLSMNGRIEDVGGSGLSPSTAFGLRTFT